LSISTLIKLNIPDFTVLATLKWVSVGNWVASWWAVAIFRLTILRFVIKESVVRTADVCFRNQVLAFGAGILSVSALILLNIPDFTVLATFKWVSVGNGVASWWAVAIFRLTFSRFAI